MLRLVVCAVLLAGNTAAAARRAFGPSDRSLYIRSLPAIEGVQSNLFEVHMTPYTFTPKPIEAVAVLQGESGVAGMLKLHQEPAGPVFVTGNITGLSPGLHGLHVHYGGDTSKGCQGLGGHFNPYMFQHGGPKDILRHLGDLGNVEAKEDGTAQVKLVDPAFSLGGGVRGVLGRALAVTSARDDLGLDNSKASETDGSSGEVLACGPIVINPH